MCGFFRVNIPHQRLDYTYDNKGEIEDLNIASEE